MKAIVLCAGFGTRLMPLTREQAKPLLPVAGAPIVEHLLRDLDASGEITAVSLVSNHRFHEDFSKWRDGARFEHFRIEVLDNGVTSLEEQRGAVSDLLWAKRRMKLDEPILAAAGDNLFRISFAAFFSDVASRDGSVVATYHEPELERLRRTGVAEVSGDGRIEQLIEKPDHPPSSWACPALYGLTKSALASLDEYVACASEADNLGGFLSWLVERQTVYAHPLQGERWDIGDRASYEAAEDWWSQRERQ